MHIYFTESGYPPTNGILHLNIYNLIFIFAIRFFLHCHPRDVWVFIYIRSSDTLTKMRPEIPREYQQTQPYYQCHHLQLSRLSVALNVSQNETYDSLQHTEEWILRPIVDAKPEAKLLAFSMTKDSNVSHGYISLAPMTGSWPSDPSISISLGISHATACTCQAVGFCSILKAIFKTCADIYSQRG